MNSSSRTSYCPTLSLALLFACLIVIPSIGNAQLVNNNGALISITDGATMIVKNGSVLNGVNNSGYISNAGELIVEEDMINNDTSTSGMDKGVYRVQRDWINNGVFIADSGLVELYGADQFITGDSVTEYHVLELTGTGIKTQTLDAITNNELRLNDRELATDDNKHFMTNTATAAITRTTGFVSSEDVGRLVRLMEDNSDYLFPVGSSNGTLRYRPIEIRPTTVAPHTMEVRMANTDATTEGFNRLITGPDICQVNEFYYHQIDRTNGVDPGRINFFFDPTLDGQFVSVAHWQNQPRWEDVGPPQQGTNGAFTTFAINGWSFDPLEAYGLALTNPDVVGVVTDGLCFGDSTGSVDITVTGGSPAFTYTWSNGTTLEDLINAPAGTYTLDVNDINSCGRSDLSFTITEPTEVEVLSDPTSPPCHPNNGGGLGSIDVTVSGGTPGYVFTWSDNSTNEDLIDVLSGTYTLTITDNNGCASTITEDIEVPDELIASLDYSDISCFGAGDGGIATTVSGGTPVYTYLWSSGDFTQDLIDLGPGDYNLQLIDGNGCVLKTSDLEITIIEPDPLDLTVFEDQTIYIGQTADLEASSIGGTGAYTYVWDDATTLSDSVGSFVSAMPEETTTYTATVFDDNGCTDDTLVTIIVNTNAFQFPNAFTPNGSEDNVYEPILEINHTLRMMKVFNRWGQLVYEGNTGWDGTMDGTLQPTDTYIIQAQVLDPFGKTIDVQQEVILLR